MTRDGTRPGRRLGFPGIALALLPAVAWLAATGGPAGAQAPEGLVETTEGPVQGVRDPATGVWEFRGVPYAAPPTGARRFARPAPPVARSGLLVAATSPSACPQLAGALAGDCAEGAAEGEVVGSEDCLALNVFTPAATWPPPATLPVMVFVHGGAFEGGCERASTPALAADGGVVLIRIQYRVGLLGFMATEEMAAADEDGSAGNWGVLDMVRALEWVHANVSAFGGDPRNVTVFGESAGGVAVCALAASPLAKGLFRRAIVESGHCEIARPLRTTPGSAVDGATQAQIGAEIAREIGCGVSGETRLDCLRALSAATIVGIQPELGALGLGSLQATLDGHVLDERPLTMLRERPTPAVTLVVGSNRDEYSAVALLDPATGDAVRRDYAAAVRDGLESLGQVFRPFPLASLADDLVALYPDPGDPEARLEQYATLFGELYGNCPALELAEVVAARRGRAYLYHFSRGVPSPVPQLAALGAFHSLELFYVFGNLGDLRALSFQPGPEDEDLSRRMIAAWSGFAATGVPATEPAWPAWTRAGRAFYEWTADGADPVRALYRDGRCTALAELRRAVDRDLDLVADGEDNCPGVANASQIDTDRDGVGDACAACPGEPRLGRRGSPAGGGGRLIRARCARRAPFVHLLPRR